MGSCAISGALIEMVSNFSALSGAAVGAMSFGLVLFAVAVVIVTKAGLQRDKILAELGQGIQGIA